MDTNHTVILGAGLAGLSAGSALVRAGKQVVIIEAASQVGGLAKTIVRDGFRFDLGGHRFLTNKPWIEGFVRELMGDELLCVPRKSRIFLQERYIEYPLQPQDAVLGLGMGLTIKILSGYVLERLKRRRLISLEDWVVSEFGRPLFNLYFKEYSEKVWGIGCEYISAEWVSKRINGLSLTAAIKDALFKLDRKKIPTLADSFLYPGKGIGQIGEKLKGLIINQGSRILTNTRVEEISRSHFKIEGIAARNSQHLIRLRGEQYISSIPITSLVKMLQPQAPDEIIDAASKLRYRDLIVVALMINRQRVTDQSWIYFPEERIPFGRIHEPTNWSKNMSPADKTMLVVEYFCFQGDKIWGASNQGLSDLTGEYLQGLGLVKQGDIVDTMVVRVPQAYPLLEVGYREYYDKVMNYLSRFENLHLAGRTGTFAYKNIDEAIESGLLTAESIIKNKEVVRGTRRDKALLCLCHEQHKGGR